MHYSIIKNSLKNENSSVLFDVLNSVHGTNSKRSFLYK